MSRRRDRDGTAAEYAGLEQFCTYDICFYIYVDNLFAPKNKLKSEGSPAWPQDKGVGKKRRHNARPRFLLPFSAPLLTGAYPSSYNNGDGRWTGRPKSPLKGH